MKESVKISADAAVTNAPPPVRRSSSVLPWLALMCICLAYVGGTWALHPTYFFGLTHDDMLYFTSAKALAEHRGYIQPSLPGSPLATKYPVLYPWLLSWVWRWNPSFPANLSGAIWINLIFGLILILASYRIIRQTQGLSKSEALFLVGFCALHPLVLFYSGNTLAEVPFAALALTGLILADSAMRRDARIALSLACGVILGLTILVRSAGVPLALGLILAAVLRRCWRQALAFTVSFTPFFVGLFWRSILAVPPAPNGVYLSTARGWQQAWLYYTDYVAFRRMASPSLHMVGQFALNQVLYLPSEIAAYFLSPLSEKSIIFWFGTTLLVFCTVCVGWARQAKTSEWAPAHVGAALYTLTLLSWDFPDWQRFMLLFLPLITAALWAQGKKWTLQMASAARSRPSYVEKLAAGSMVVLFLVVLTSICWNYAASSRVWFRSVRQKREALLLEKKEAYAWLRSNARPDERVIAAEDGSVYLYTGLQSMVPMIPSPGGAYDEGQVNSDLDHMMDVGRAIRAKYWLVSSDDIDKTQKFLKPSLASRSRELQAVLPVLFRSDGGHILIYDLACVDNPGTPPCRNVAPVLFPEGIPIGEAVNGQD